ncbi:MAG: hypothetical protein QOC77_14 [Thermoleophilaceae bacterium]|nr:hypothetical protein [Thermoleophilaceae bacterium]
MRGLRRVLGAAVTVALLAGCGGAIGPSGSGAGSLPFDGRSPLDPPGKRMRVLVELRRPSLATQVRARGLSARAQRAYVASLGGEARALESALEAKGVRLGHTVLLARVWNGFAATVDAGDLPQLRALGLRAEPVRRFYGASSASGAVAGEGALSSKGGGGKGAVALLDSGVALRAPGLAGRVVPGFDAAGGRAQAGLHGTQVAQVLAQALGPGGGTIVSIRVAGLERDPRTGARVEVGTTDELLAGLERTVDPNGDGDTSDHIPVALVGVNSPYAGFADSPDAVAAGAARALGTLVVAPAGNEGPGGGALGTVGSPAAAPGVLAVGALDGGGGPALPSVRLGLATGEGRALLRGTVLAGGGGSAKAKAKALRAPVANLGGPSQANPRERGRALGGTSLEYFGVDAKPRARGRVVIVPARPGVGGAAGVVGAAARGAGGPSGRGGAARASASAGPPLAVRAAAADEAGAVALVVCEPDPTRPLQAIPDAASGVPVIGLRGDAAAKALELTPHDGGLAFLSAPEAQTAPKAVVPAPASSRGPTYSLAPKPDIAAMGTARVDGQLVAGTSVAAARVAAAAAATRTHNPSASPDDIAAALVGTARPLGPQTWTGAGALDAAAAPNAAVLVEPSTLGLGSIPAAPAAPAPGQIYSKLTIGQQFTVKNPSDQPAQVALKVALRGPTATVTPASVTVAPHTKQHVTLTITVNSPKPGFGTGRITATKAGAAPVRATIGLLVGTPPRPKLGPLTLVGAGGVRFTAGALTEMSGLRTVEPLGLLRLELTDAQNHLVRELTPIGGAPDLLPGEYAYTLTKTARSALKKGMYSFTARAKGPAGGPELVRKSPSFTVR